MRSFIATHARTLSFLGVLALTSTLVLVLFDEARAVDVQIDAPESVSTTDGTAVVSINIVIPDGQLIPIESLEAVVYDRSGDLVASGSCDADGCMDPVTSGVDAILSILPDGSVPDATPGYLSWTAGGSPVIADGLNELAGYGYGYGYGYGGPAGGELAFDVTLDLEALGPGFFDVVFIVHARGTTIGDIESSPAEIQITSGQGGGTGGGNAGGVPASGGLPPGLEIAPGIVEHRADGSTLAQTVIPPGLTDNPAIDLRSVDPRLETLTIDSDAAPPGSTVSVVVRDTPPAGMPDLPGTFAPGTLFLEISITLPDGTAPRDDAEAPEAQISFRIPGNDLGSNSASTVTLLHFTGGRWVAEETERAFTVGDVHVYVSTFRGFSPFAVAFDDEAPGVTILGPLDGRTVGVRPLIAATLADNRGIDTSKTTLTIDNQKVAATVGASSIRFTPAVPLTPGQHTAVVRAVDESGLETVARTTFTVRPGGDPTAPVVTITSPADGSVVTSSRPTFQVSLSDDRGVEASSVSVVLDGLAVPVRASATGFTFAPDVDLADGVHELAVSADDANGNGGFAVTTFTVDTIAPSISLRDLSKLDINGLVDGRLKVSATLSGEAITTVTFTLDGEPILDVSKSGNVYTLDRPVAEGVHTLVVSATDEAGNVESTSYTFTSTQTEELEPSSIEESSDKGTPGFGLVLAVLALAGVALLARRK